MLATLVIGLREGLEAALIVGIIAAFLKRNGKSLTAMWIGVVAAVILSILVGVTLNVVERALPQAEQEAMETVIGAIAVVFVTGMIVWMRTHARFMKRELEDSATDALGHGTSLALAGMAFLAVLKEGFETSVFLLATFQASTSVTAAVIGAVVGILVAAAIGIGLYTGGVKLNLGKFFTVTGVFLVFVAAGLVISALRTAHEAGWIVVGQQSTVDLSWLAPGGSIRAALITGVLGIPADPRAIEAVGWFAYLVPMLLITLLPASLRPSREHRPRAYALAAAGLGLAAIALFAFVPTVPDAALPASVRLADSGHARLEGDRAAPTLEVTTAGEHRTIHFAAADAAPSTKNGADTVWRRRVPGPDRPSTLSIDELVRLNGGHLPVGFNATRNPGPYHATWNQHVTVTAWTAGGRLIDTTGKSTAIATVSGGGLSDSRVVTLPADTDWTVPQPVVDKNAAAIAGRETAAHDRALWKTWLPAALAVGAIATAARAAALRRAARRAEEAAGNESTTDEPTTETAGSARSSASKEKTNAT